MRPFQSSQVSALEFETRRGAYELATFAKNQLQFVMSKAINSKTNVQLHELMQIMITSRNIPVDGAVNKSQDFDMF